MFPCWRRHETSGIPIRIGVNAGSLDEDLAARNDLTLPEKLAESARGYVEFCESQGFYDLVVSAKAHDVSTTVEAYRLLQKLYQRFLFILVSRKQALCFKV